MIRALLLWLLLPLVAAVGASARTVDRFATMHGGVRIEISASRADILRVRIGRADLPEDASWAVLPGVRTAYAPLDVHELHGLTELRTAALTATLDPATMALCVRDASGRVVLADAPGTALAFEGTGHRLRKAMPQDAHYFGLGDKTGPLDRRGGSYVFWNTDAFGFTSATDPIYKSVPFVLGLTESGTSFGLFVDNSWRQTFDFGKAERDVLTLSAEGGPIDYYVMVGPDPRAIVQSYAHLTGTAPLAPLWSLGFQQSHWSYMTQGEAQSIADRLRADRIPADVLWLDIDYQDRNRPFTVDTKAYPDLAGLVRPHARTAAADCCDYRSARRRRPGRGLCAL